MNSQEGFTQLAMVHRLPRARLVDRIEYLSDAARGERVVHVGFVDAGCQSMQEEADAWLHGHLGRVTDRLVGLDIDPDGVAAARTHGYEAHVEDCTDPAAVGALGLAPADVVIAGEVIEHLDEPGRFLDAMTLLVRPGGRLVLTTPNASGVLNGAAALAGFEINHPDHVAMFSWRTLHNLLDCHGWDTVESATFVPVVKGLRGRGTKLRLLGIAARGVLFLERTIGRWWAPFVADGLIVVARRSGRSHPPDRRR